MVFAGKVKYTSNWSPRKRISWGKVIFEYNNINIFQNRYKA